MKTVKFLILSALSILIISCASGYKKINPNSLVYYSKSEVSNVILEYKYNLLNGKYLKKEMKNDVRVVAVKITNNSEKDIIFGKDVQLTYDSGNDVKILETNEIFTKVKQSPASYLWYLLLSPMQIYKTEYNGYGEVKTKSFPIGLIVGPGIAAGNLIAASDANKNFKNELTNNNILGKIIKKGETAYGIVGLQSSSYDGLKLKFN